MKGVEFVKIYHRKNFWVGLGMMVLGLLNLILALWRRDLDLSAGILAGALLLLGISSLLRSLSPKLSQQDRIEERDERNVTIREKAAYSSWYWSLYLLWGLWLLTLVTQGGMYVAFVSAAIVLHCIFYMVNVGRWSRRM